METGHSPDASYAVYFPTHNCPGLLLSYKCNRVNKFTDLATSKESQVQSRWPILTRQWSYWKCNACKKKQTVFAACRPASESQLQSSYKAARDQCLAQGCLSRANAYQHRSLNPDPPVEGWCPFHRGALPPPNTKHQDWQQGLRAYR